MPEFNAPGAVPEFVPRKPHSRSSSESDSSSSSSEGDVTPRRLSYSEIAQKRRDSQESGFASDESSGGEQPMPTQHRRTQYPLMATPPLAAAQQYFQQQYWQQCLYQQQQQQQYLLQMQQRLRSPGMTEGKLLRMWRQQLEMASKVERSKAVRARREARRRSGGGGGQEADTSHGHNPLRKGEARGV